MFLEQNAWVSQKQDARGNLVVASLPSTFPFPPSAESVCCERPLDWTWLIPFFLTKMLELTLSCISQATQYSPSMESPEDIQLVNKGWLSLVKWQLPRALLQGDSAGLPHYEYFAAGFSTYPCHMAFIACLMTAFFALRSKAIVRTFLATMLCSGIFNLRKEVLLRYCFCCVR